MRSREKYFWQSVIGLVAAFYLVFSVSESSNQRVLELFVSLGAAGSRSTCRPGRADGAVLQGNQLPAGVFGFMF
jgi:phospho-N-acetylmuramoyl-pentapeptide-transferase